MRKNWMRPGAVSRWDMRRRAALRAWNDADTWVAIADWICGPGLLIFFAGVAVMFLAAWSRLGG